jgi:hypothetical protein
MGEHKREGIMGEHKREGIMGEHKREGIRGEHKREGIRGDGYKAVQRIEPQPLRIKPAGITGKWMLKRGWVLGDDGKWRLPR